MAVEIRCGKCSKRFRVAEKFAGKRVKCPNCGGPIRVGDDAEQPSGDSGVGAAAETASPVEATSGSSPKLDIGPPKSDRPSHAPPGESSAKPSAAADAGADQWYLQTDDGEQYGPVDRAELDEWFAEGRIDESCQILRDGWDQWQWAEEVFPELRNDGGEVTAGFTLPGSGSGRRSGAPTARSAASSSGTTLGDAGPVSDALAASRPWIFLLAMVGLILGGLALLGGLAWMVIVLVTGAWPLIVVALMSGITGGLQAWMAYLLLSYAQKIGKYARDPTHEALEETLRTAGAFWRLAGILVLVIVGLWLVATILSVILTLVLG